MKILFAAALSACSPAMAANLVDCSRAVVTGNNAITLMAPGAAVTGFMIQNIDSREAMWFSVTGPVVPGALGSFILPPAQAKGFSTDNFFRSPPGLAPLAFVSVTASTPGHKVSCAYW
jgi:hypothetical protein